MIIQDLIDSWKSAREAETKASERPKCVTTVVDIPWHEMWRLDSELDKHSELDLFDKFMLPDGSAYRMIFLKYVWTKE